MSTSRGTKYHPEILYVRNIQRRQMFISSQKKTEREKILQVYGNLKSKEETIGSFWGKESVSVNV